MAMVVQIYDIFTIKLCKSLDMLHPRHFFVLFILDFHLSTADQTRFNMVSEERQGTEAPV